MCLKFEKLEKSKIFLVTEKKCAKILKIWKSEKIFKTKNMIIRQLNKSNVRILDHFFILAHN